MQARVKTVAKKAALRVDWVPHRFAVCGFPLMGVAEWSQAPCWPGTPTSYPRENQRATIDTTTAQIAINAETLAAFADSRRLG